MANDSGFKVPTIDPQMLAKGRKVDLPASVSKVHIPLTGTCHPEVLGPRLETDSAEIPPIPYREPAWSRKGDRDTSYWFEVLKNGVIVERIMELQHKAFWIFGRLPNCDLNMAHPTISRYHAILQYRPPVKPDSDDEDGSGAHVTIEPGWYLYDLNSTHGTFLNKQRLVPRTYVRVRVGYMIRLGSSSRTYILNGPPGDEDEPSPLTITELKEQQAKARQLQEELAEIERLERERIELLKEEEGVNWGMVEDADEETDLTENPYAMSNNEELFLDDPKKTLRGFFEREGHDLDYKLEERSAGTFCCRVELPLDDANGRPLVAEVTHKGKKKETVVQCALEACRILDRHGVLRQAHHEPRRRHQKHSDSDDDDDFLDRTGDVEKKRQKKLNKSTDEAMTYEDLIREEAKLLESMEAVDHKLERHQTIGKGTRLPDNDEDVDSFLQKLTDGAKLDKFTTRRLRMEREDMVKRHAKLRKMIELAKPFELPAVAQVAGPSTAEERKRKMMPLFGKPNKLSRTFGIKESEIKAAKDSDEEQEEPNVDEAVVQPQKQEPTKAKPMAKRSTVAHARVSEECPQSVAPEDEMSVTEKQEDALSSKKRSRQRVRVRGKNRENVDFDDSDELRSDDKNISWVPPANQTGDGMTSLNERYGY